MGSVGIFFPDYVVRVCTISHCMMNQRNCGFDLSKPGLEYIFCEKRVLCFYILTEFVKLLPETSCFVTRGSSMTFVRFILLYMLLTVL